MKQAFTGTLALAWVALSRDRIQLPIWIVAITLFKVFVLAAWNGDLTDEELLSVTQFYGVHPAMRLFGLASGPTLGAYVMSRGFVLFAVLIALMSILFVVRHTRQDEDTGRAEYINSAVVGRHANLASAFMVAVGANIVLALLISLVFIFNDLPVAGSFAAGAAYAGVGIFFAGVASVTAQLAATSRGATGLALLALGVAFALPGIGNMLGQVDEEGVRIISSWPAWLSPLGWGQQMRPFAEDHWSLLGLYGFFFVAFALVGFYLETRRDIGKGFLPEKPGPAEAAPSLLSPLGLVWRLQRGAFVGWAIAVTLFSILFGAVSGDIDALLEELEEWTDIFERIGGTDVMIDAAFVTFVGIFAAVIAIYAVQVLLRMRLEESDGPAESVMATAVSRQRWIMGYIVNSVLGAAALLLMAGLAMGISAGVALDELGTWVSDLVVAALVQLPAVLVIIGIVVAAFGLLPRRVGLIAWLVLAVAIITGPWLAGILDLPEWAENISPFSHAPAVPAEAVTATPILAMLAVAIVLVGIGILAFRRRDIDLPAG